MAKTKDELKRQKQKKIERISIIPKLESFIFEKGYIICFVVLAALFCKYLYNAWHYGFTFETVDYKSFLLTLNEGFISKGLIGSILLALSDDGTISLKLVGAYCVTVAIIRHTLCTVLLLCLIKGKQPKEKTQIMVFATLIMGSLSLYGVYSELLLSFYDGVWFIFLFASLLVVSKKKLSFIIPMFCFMGIFVHYGFSLFVFPTLFMLHYFETQKDGFKKTGLVSLVLNAVVSAGATVYFYFFARNTVTVSFEQLMDRIYERSDGIIMRGYFEVFENRYWPIIYDTYLSNDRGSLIDNIKSTVTTYIGYSSAWKIALSVAVFLIFFTGAWIYSAVKEKRMEKKLFYIVMAVLPLITIPLMFTAADLGRWTYAFCLSQMIAVLYISSYKQSPVNMLLYSDKKRNVVLMAVLLVGCVVSWIIGTFIL